MSAHSVDDVRAAFFAIALIVVGLPHVLEDFAVGEPARYGVAIGVAVSVLLAAYGAQVIGAWLAMRGNPSGGRIIATVGLIWIAGALVLHGPEVWAEGLHWRSGPMSLVEVTLLVVVAALAVWYGAKASQSGSRTK